MDVLKEVIIDSFKLPCFDPPNFKLLKIDIPDILFPLLISPNIIYEDKSDYFDYHIFPGNKKKKFKGFAIKMEDSEEIKVLSGEDYIVEMNSLLKIIKNDEIDRIIPHQIKTGTCFKLDSSLLKHMANKSNQNKGSLASNVIGYINSKLSEKNKTLIGIQSEDLELILKYYSFDVQNNYLLITQTNKIEDERIQELFNKYSEYIDVTLSKLYI